MGDSGYVAPGGSSSLSSGRTKHILTTRMTEPKKREEEKRHIKLVTEHKIVQ